MDDLDGLLRDNAAAYARVALANIAREFPCDVRHLMTGPDDLPRRPRERTPVFYGSYDWHSCVEMHWLLVRLLRRAPGLVPAGEIRAALDAAFTAAGLRAEAEFIAAPANRTRERPYGWGWALLLAHELSSWDDPHARRWAANIAPLADVLARLFLDWLPRATYPIRHGVHANSAFGLGLALPYAIERARAGGAGADTPGADTPGADTPGAGTGLRDALVAAARRWYRDDTDYPAGWEPSGADFLSPALVEAELMARVLPAGEFAGWLDRFLPGLARGEPGTLFTPVTVSDPSDGQIAHLHGLNLSRAWCWRRLAECLPAGDPRVGPAREAMLRHAEAGLPHAVGGDYLVEHWLACYAVALLT
jgi:DUF2891 family protein